MASESSSKNESRRAAHLVLAIVGVGLGAGGIMIATFGFAMSQAQDSHKANNQIAEHLNRVLSNVNRVLTDSHQEMTALLAGRPLNRSGRGIRSRPRRISTHWAATELRSPATASSLDALDRALLDVTDCGNRIRRWHADQIAMTAARTASDRLCDQTLSRLREALERTAGRERLDRALLMRTYQASKGTPDPEIVRQLVDSNLASTRFPRTKGAWGFGALA